MKIVIVDEYEKVRRFVADELTNLGHTVNDTGEPSEILGLMNEFPPDVVLLDLFLEKRHRWDLLHEIKKRVPAVPVVLFTGYEGYKHDPRVSEADGFVLKSSSLDSLLEYLDGYFPDLQRSSDERTMGRFAKKNVSTRSVPNQRTKSEPFR